MKEPHFIERTSTVEPDVHDFEAKRPIPVEAQRFLAGFVSDEDLESIELSPQEAEKVIGGVVMLLGARSARTDPRTVITSLFVSGEQTGQPNNVDTRKVLPGYIKSCAKTVGGSVSLQELMYLSEIMNVTTFERRFETRKQLIASLANRALGETIVPPEQVPAQLSRTVPATAEEERPQLEPLQFEPIAEEINSSNWRKFASCNLLTSYLFIDDTNIDKAGKIESAKRICGGCEARDYCLQYALDNNEENGVWGGLDSDERAALRRRAFRASQK